MNTSTKTAWDLIGFGGNLQDLDEDAPYQTASVRIIGGRTLYEAVDFNDETRGGRVRLARLQVTEHGIRQINRYVDPDTPVEIIPD